MEGSSWWVFFLLLKGHMISLRLGPELCSVLAHSEVLALDFNHPIAPLPSAKNPMGFKKAGGREKRPQVPEKGIFRSISECNLSRTAVSTISSTVALTKETRFGLSMSGMASGRARTDVRTVLQLEASLYTSALF